MEEKFEVTWTAKLIIVLLPGSHVEHAYLPLNDALDAQKEGRRLCRVQITFRLLGSQAEGLVPHQRRRNYNLSANHQQANFASHKRHEGGLGAAERQT